MYVARHPHRLLDAREALSLVAGSFAAAMPTDPDQDILDLLDAGKRDRAIRELMARYGKPVYRYVCFELRNASNCDDIHSRIFIEADRDLHRFARRSTLRSWLYGIARHRILDARKSRTASNARLSSLDDQEEPPVDGPTPAEMIDDARLKEALRECLEKLSEQVREAVVMNFLLGMTFEEISVVTGEKSGTVQARVARAKDTLRDCVEKRTRGRV